jgi:uncharacterized protein (DUF1330 family)
MRSNYKLLIGVVAGLFVGAVATNAIRSQQVKAPPAYVISEVDTITDPTALKGYAAKAPETLAPFNGHFVVRGGKTESLDGDAPPKGIVVIGFDSAEQAHAWYDSPAYASIRAFRLGAAKGRMFIVQGVAR